MPTYIEKEFPRTTISTTIERLILLQQRDLITVLRTKELFVDTCKWPLLTRRTMWPLSLFIDPPPPHPPVPPPPPPFFWAYYIPYKLYLSI